MYFHCSPGQYEVQLHYMFMKRPNRSFLSLLLLLMGVLHPYLELTSACPSMGIDTGKLEVKLAQVSLLPEVAVAIRCENNGPSLYS